LGWRGTPIESRSRPDGTDPGPHAPSSPALGRAHPVTHTTKHRTASVSPDNIRCPPSQKSDLYIPLLLSRKAVLIVGLPRALTVDATGPAAKRARAPAGTGRREGRSFPCLCGVKLLIYFMVGLYPRFLLLTPGPHHGGIASGSPTPNAWPYRSMSVPPAFPTAPYVLPEPVTGRPSPLSSFQTIREKRSFK